MQEKLQKRRSSNHIITEIEDADLGSSQWMTSSKGFWKKINAKDFDNMDAKNVFVISLFTAVIVNFTLEHLLGLF